METVTGILQFNVGPPNQLTLGWSIPRRLTLFILLKIIGVVQEILEISGGKRLEQPRNIQQSKYLVFPVSTGQLENTKTREWKWEWKREREREGTSKTEVNIY